jgi:hypothetical protein
MAKEKKTNKKKHGLARRRQAALSAMRTRYDTALHEAGHAVIARKFGVGVDYISMIREHDDDDDDDGGEQLVTFGCVYLTRTSKIFPTDEAVMSALQRDAMIALGGFAADIYWARRRHQKRPALDHSDKLKVADFTAQIVVTDMILKGKAIRRLTNKQKAMAAAAHLERLTQQTLALVAEHWPTIEHVAGVLESRDILTGAELDALIVAGEEKTPASRDIVIERERGD